jgi:hypothetical protein
VRGRGRKKRSTGKHAGDGRDGGVGREGWWKHGGIGWGSIEKQSEARKRCQTRKTRTRDWSGIIQAFFCKMTFASSKTCRREYYFLLQIQGL